MGVDEVPGHWVNGLDGVYEKHALVLSLALDIQLAIARTDHTRDERQNCLEFLFRQRERLEFPVGELGGGSHALSGDPGSLVMHINFLNDHLNVQDYVFHVHLVSPEENSLAEWLAAFHSNIQLVSARTQMVKLELALRVGERGKRCLP